MLEKLNLNKILQYVAQTIAIYLIFKYIPSQSINNRDIIIITIIITLFCILMENIIEPSKSQKEQICSTICSNKKTENMTSLDSDQEMNNTDANQETNNMNQETNNMNQEAKNESIDYDKIKKQSDMLLNNELKDLSNLPTSEEENNFYSSLYPATFYKINPSDNIERTAMKSDQSLVRSDMPYNDYNHLPIPKDYVSIATDYGYSFLPPEKWYPQPPFPPVCVTEKRCPVIPLYTTGTNVNLKDWDNARRITPPDNINTKYTKEVLNSGI